MQDKPFKEDSRCHWDETDVSAAGAPPRSAEPLWPQRSTMTPSKHSRKTRRRPAQQPEPAAAGGLTPEVMEQLKQLGELHEQNVLSDEEFEREKAKLLGSA